MHLPLTLLTLVLGGAHAWSPGPGYGGQWRGNGQVSDGAPACSPGNIISLSGRDGTYLSYCQNCTEASTGDFSNIPIHATVNPSDESQKWTVVRPSILDPGKIALQNLVTKQFLSRCTGGSCASFTKGQQSPLLLVNRQPSSNEMWECGSIGVPTSMHPSGRLMGLLGGDGKFLAFLTQDLIPTTQTIPGHQVGLLDVSRDRHMDSRVLLEVHLLFDSNA
ncbi:MAG: hypothetical protein DHS80DRAFT_28925 [Piptocephalis tieghemiana]|nr:MAG: hypothetical protein DHS80DRAFT_28925 [Piptocephalis tieghemiana]